ncbi:hypothetical protein F3J34_50540 [Klebsiella sp. Ap-873]|nr:hypothetical protein [Klebsiella sp. Ap-873]
MIYLEERILALLNKAYELESFVIKHQQDVSRWSNSPNLYPDYQEWINDGHDKYEVPFFDTLKSIYLSVSLYVEKNNSPKYLSIFHSVFGEDYEECEHYNEFSYDDYWTGMFNNTFLLKINQFLGPFEFFDSNNKGSGLIYLENILHGTESYLNVLGINPTKESDVYQPVKQVVNVVFPSSSNAGSAFLKPNKQYKPDILVPELKAAIEYKYANSRDRLNKNIEEVVSDTQGYTNDFNYSFFYAVFYVTQDFIGINRFMETWKQHNFPKNWVPIYVVGH